MLMVVVVMVVVVPLAADCGDPGCCWSWCWLFLVLVFVCEDVPTTDFFRNRYLPSQDTHGPSDVPKMYLKPYSGIVDPVRRQLAAKLSVLDELIANVTNALDAKGMLRHTLIVYTADNGGPIKQSIPGPTDAIGASNFPLRGGKHNAYEGGVRSTAWISGGPLDAAVVAAGGVAPSVSPEQARVSWWWWW
jgi:hypothetical protein